MPTARSRTHRRSRTCRWRAATRWPRPCRRVGISRAPTCSDGSPITNINVAAGEVITCTFTNNKRGSITVVKDATPDDAQDFAFTAGGGLSPTSFSLDDDANATLIELAPVHQPGARQRVLGFRDGARPDGTRRPPSAATGVRCPTSASAPGENVTCTFTNRKRGQIVDRQGRHPRRPAGLRLHRGRRPVSPPPSSSTTTRTRR